MTSYWFWRNKQEAELFSFPLKQIVFPVIRCGNIQLLFFLFCLFVDKVFHSFLCCGSAWMCCSVTRSTPGSLFSATLHWSGGISQAAGGWLDDSTAPQRRDLIFCVSFLPLKSGQAFLSPLHPGEKKKKTTTLHVQLKIQEFMVW